MVSCESCLLEVAKYKLINHDSPTILTTKLSGEWLQVLVCKSTAMIPWVKDHAIAELLGSNTPLDRELRSATMMARLHGYRSISQSRIDWYGNALKLSHVSWHRPIISSFNANSSLDSNPV